MTRLHVRTKALPSDPSADAETKFGEETTRSWHRENRQLLFLALSVALFMVIAHFTPLRAWITNVQLWKEHVRQLGGIAHGSFFLLMALSVMTGIPRLALCAVAGLIFGFGEGLVLSLFSSTLGSYGAFLLARKGGRKAVLDRASKWTWLQPMLESPSWLRVFWVRQLMLPGIVLNVMLGVTSVRQRVFLMGTVLGYLPLNIAFALVGSGLGKDSLAKTLMQLLMALGIFNIIGWAVWRWVTPRAAKSLKVGEEKKE